MLFWSFIFFIFFLHAESKIEQFKVPCKHQINIFENCLEGKAKKAFQEKRKNVEEEFPPSATDSDFVEDQKKVLQVITEQVAYEFLSDLYITKKAPLFIRLVTGTTLTWPFSINSKIHPIRNFTINAIEKQSGIKKKYLGYWEKEGITKFCQKSCSAEKIYFRAIEIGIKKALLEYDQTAEKKLLSKKDFEKTVDELAKLT